MLVLADHTTRNCCPDPANNANNVLDVTFRENIRTVVLYGSITVKSSSGKIIPINKVISCNFLYITQTTGIFNQKTS